MKICSGSLSLAKSLTNVATSDLGSLAVRILSSFRLASLRRLLSGWLPALMCGRISSMFVGLKPFDATFTVQMLCSASPLAVHAIKYSEAIFDFGLLEFDVDFALVSYTDKVSGLGLIGSINLGRSSA